MACARCKLPYPGEMLNPVMGNFADSGKPVCGICALEIVNEAHGTRMKRFHGELAEGLRLRAINWRRKHPNAQPVAV
jgi:hypothetical protein